MSDSINGAATWDIQAARTLYNIDRWGAKYFDINENGRVVCRPLHENGATVSPEELIERAKSAPPRERTEERPRGGDRDRRGGRGGRDRERR